MAKNDPAGIMSAYRALAAEPTDTPHEAILAAALCGALDAIDVMSAVLTMTRRRPDDMAGRLRDATAAVNALQRGRATRDDGTRVTR